MSPLKLEVETPKGWNLVGYVTLRDQPSPLPSNTPEGHCIYIFECLPNDSASKIYRSKSAAYTDNGNGWASVSLLRDDLELVKELKRGDEPYEMTVELDKNPDPRKIRLTHE